VSGKRIIFYILAVFVAGTFLLVYIEYNSTKHVNALITANKKLLEEFQITKNLLEADKDIVSIQRNLRGFVESGDTAYLTGLENEFTEIETAQTFLLTISDDSNTVTLVHELDSLIEAKVNLLHKVLNTSSLQGIKAAEDTINANLSAWVSSNIENTVRKITNRRGNELISITKSLEASGEKALEFSYILIVLVLVGAAVVFWYVIHIIQRLIRSEKKVRETARIKENFLANMSHEIRTPMNAILGFTQLLEQKNLDEDTKHYVKTIQRSGENLLAIVNDILDISKIEAGMMRIEKVPFSLRGLVDSIETMVLPKTNAKGIRFFVEIDNLIPDVLEGDAVRLTQILNNLLSNALKFTSEGFISLKIGAEEINDNVVKLKMDISDTGIGIEHQTLKDIFKRFQQADDTITRQYGGTGLGLSIVKDLVELQKGTITAESKPGKGSTFHVMIPYIISLQKIADNFALSELQSPALASPDICVLITEDNEFNQSLLSHIFKNWDIQFDIAANGLEAIEKLKTKKYDLVLMDIQMPVMDGYTTARKIRNELRSDVPIIAMTAHALPGERDKCLSYGMNDYIAKPVKQDELSELTTRFTQFTQPTNDADIATASEGNSYQYINLNYIKDVSAGNKKYEVAVTQKFLNAVPLALEELQHTLNEGNIEKMKRVAHNLKTTISVMGLNELLNPMLDEIETGNVDVAHLQEIVNKLTNICNQALEEAKDFHASLA